MKKTIQIFPRTESSSNQEPPFFKKKNSSNTTIFLLDKKINMSKNKRYGGASRKTRSIGLTCERICSRFPLFIESKESWEVSVDSVVRTLNASKGSVYEIFHVLEGILVVSKIGTKVYRWNGFQPLRTVLSFLQVIGRDCMGLEARMRRVKQHELSNLVERSKVKIITDADEEVEDAIDRSFLSSGGDDSSNDANGNIHILEACQQFVMIFLLAPDPKVITLEYAAKIIYGTNLSVQGVQSRTRRLCDMANVLTSLPIPFIEK
ncbi:E2F transcription factor 8, partial [Caligus rogercresseyi]